MKKKFLCALFLGMAVSFGFSQVAVSPSDDFYIAAEGWKLKGYIDHLPQIKPYPLNIIKSILIEVHEKGDEKNKKQAEFFTKKFFAKPWSVSELSNIDLKLKHSNESDEENAKQKFTADYLFTERLGVASDLEITKLFGFSLDFGALLRTTENTKKEVMPIVTNNDADVILPLAINADKVEFILDPNFMFTFGNEKLYGTFGINKVGYGFFPDDSLIFNSKTYQSLNLSFNYIGKIIEYSQYFGTVGAQSYRNENKFKFGKFFAFHALKFPIKKAHIGISLYESAIFAKPFMPAYLLPIPYTIVANVAGFNDNVLSGLMFEWQPVKCFALSFDLMFDDFNPKKMLKLKLDQGAVRTGFKTGIKYSPLDSFCEFISVSYTLVTPFTYTKYNTIDEKFNYLDYTNFGQSMGTSLLPNSDTISMTIRFRPVSGLKLSAITSFTRHGNAYESIEDNDILDNFKKGYVSDGSIRMDAKKGLDEAVDETNFLKQDHIMYVIQAAFLGEYELVIKRGGRLNFTMQYTFEFIEKDGVDKNIFSGSYKTLESVKSARKRWEDALHDSFNHYITIGIKYTY